MDNLVITLEVVSLLVVMELLLVSVLMVMITKGLLVCIQ